MNLIKIIFCKDIIYIPTSNQIQAAPFYGPQDRGFFSELHFGLMNENEVIYNVLDLNLLQKQKITSGSYPGNQQLNHVGKIIKKEKKYEE